MPTRLIGYARASVAAPTLERQEQALRAAGCSIVFREELPERPSRRFVQRAAAIGDLQKGDTFLICSLDRLARSLPDLVATIWSIICLGCSFRSLAEPLTLRPDGPDDGRTTIAAIAAAAKAQDAEIFAETEKTRQKPRGRKDKLTEKDWPAVAKMLESHGVTQVAEHFGVSRPTIYNLRKRMG